MKIIIFILSLFLTLTLSAQINTADEFFTNHYDKKLFREHKIKQVLVKRFSGNTKPSLHIFDFDHNGFVTKQTILDSVGKKVSEYYFTYNEHGDQVQRKNIAYDLNTTYTVSFHKTYNGKQLIKETSSELPFITIYIYNSNEQKLQSITFLGTDTSRSEKRIFDYKYDLRGRLINIVETLTTENNLNSAIIGNTEYIYDQLGNVIAVNRKGEANYKLNYDNFGLLKSMTTEMTDEFENFVMTDEYLYIFRE